jgi:FtsX-like permease family
VPRASTLVFAGFAVTRLRRRWRLALSMEIGLVLAVALAVSVTLVQSATAQIGLRRALDGLGDRGWVQVAGYGARDGATLEMFRGAARDEARTTMGPLLRPGASFLATSALIPVSLAPGGKPVATGAAGPELAAYPDLADHVELVAGAPAASVPPGGDWQATMSQQAASQLGVRAGDRYCLADTVGSSFCVRVMEVWRARDPSDGWWGPGHVPTASLLVDLDSYAAILKGLSQVESSAFATFTPVPTAFRQYQVPDLLDRMRQLRGHYTVARSDTVISTGLDTGLQAYWDRFQGAAFATGLVAAQIVLVALFYLAFASGHVLDQQRPELAVWRSRGWRRRSVWALLMLEMALLALLALPFGIALGAAGAAASVRAVYGELPAEFLLADVEVLWQPALLAAAVGLGVLTVRAAGVSRGGLLQAHRLASRPRLRPWWQWRQLDLLLAVAGVMLLARVPLLSQGAAAAGGGPDPAALAAPGAAALLLALPALRLLPPAARLAGLAGRGVGAALATWQLSRRPLQHSLLALLLLLTIALGVFAGAYGTTQRRNALDRVAYATGADVRVQFSADLAMPPAALAAADLRDAEATSLVYRGTGKPGTAPLEPTVLGVEPSSFDRVAWSRPGLNAEPLNRLVGRLHRPGVDELELPGHPLSLGLWVYSPGLDGLVTARIEDAASRPRDLSLGSLDYAGWRYLAAPIEAGGVRPAYPFYLERLAIGLPPGGSAARSPYPSAGTVAISDLGETLPGEVQPRVLVHFSDISGQSGWFATRPDSGLSSGDLAADPTVLRDGRPVTLLTADGSAGDVVIRPVPQGLPLPALAPSSTIARLGIGLGLPFVLTIGSAKVPVVIVAAADHVPTLYPEAPQDFLVVDQLPLLAELGHQGEPHAWPNEVWARTTGAAGAADAATLRRVPGVTTVQDRRQLQAAALADPLGLGLEADLLAGFAVALALAVSAFGLHFLVAVTGRQSEYAILDANGLEPATVRRSLAIEQAVLLGFSMVVGTVLGLVLAWAVLPSLHLDTSLEATVPPTVLTIDARFTAGALAAVVVLALAAGWAATRLGRRFELMREVRALG